MRHILTKMKGVIAPTVTWSDANCMQLSLAMLSGVMHFNMQPTSGVESVKKDVLKHRTKCGI